MSASPIPPKLTVTAQVSVTVRDVDVTIPPRTVGYNCKNPLRAAAEIANFAEDFFFVSPNAFSEQSLGIQIGQTLGRGSVRTTIYDLRVPKPVIITKD